MKRKKMKEVTLAAVLALALTTTALAAPSGGGTSGTGGKATSDTTISIMQAKVNPYNVSFTVPLYMTMAVMANNTEVKVPSNYEIANATMVGTGESAAEANIGVTGMSFEKLEGSTFNTVTAAAPTADTDIHLSIGGMDMPALSSSGTSPVTIGGVLGTSEHPTAITTTKPQNLAIVGTVKSSARDEAKAVAQFRVKYTVSLLSGKGDPLGIVYAGNDKTAAGLTETQPTQPGK